MAQNAVDVAPLAGARIETIAWKAGPVRPKVAPLAGARIETPSRFWDCSRFRSLPSRERELKQVFGCDAGKTLASLPSRERELKQHKQRTTEPPGSVAPLAGARIETGSGSAGNGGRSVAPLAGARIETTAQSPHPGTPDRRSPRGSAN